MSTLSCKPLFKSDAFQIILKF